MPNTVQLLRVGTKNIVDGAITASKIADNAIITAKINDSAVTEAKIASNSITNDKIVNGSITTDKLANASVTVDKLADASVITSKLADASVTTDKLADASVIEQKIADSVITADKLNFDYLIYQCSNPHPASCSTSVIFDDLEPGLWFVIANTMPSFTTSSNDQTMQIGSDVESISRTYGENLQSVDGHISHTYVFPVFIRINNRLDVSAPTGVYNVVLIRIGKQE